METKQAITHEPMPALTMLCTTLAASRTGVKNKFSDGKWRDEIVIETTNAITATAR